MKTIFTTFILTVLFLASTFRISSAQVNWTKDANNPVMSGGASGAWDRNVWAPNVLYNVDSARYEMWFSASVQKYPLSNERLGSAWIPYPPDLNIIHCGMM